MSYKGHNCELTVDYEEGFTLKDGQTGAVVFNKNFPELVNSSDDGARLLWLEFRQVLETNPIIRFYTFSYICHFRLVKRKLIWVKIPSRWYLSSTLSCLPR